MIRTPSLAAVPALLVLFAAGPAIAQQLSVPADHPAVREAMQFMVAAEPSTIESQIAICEIPAPPFAEQRRAEDYAARLRALGLVNVRIDDEGNVIAERPGRPGEPVIVLSGHLDTVFPEGTDVTVERDGSVLRAPGIGDDCRGLAVVLAVAEALDESDIETRGTILFVGTVGEEGQGNLRGVRHLFEDELRDQVDYFISVDGAGLGVTKDAVGSYRYRVSYTGPGGHSYGAFGMPNPMHALGRAIAKFADLRVPDDPRTTFSVGIIEGGTSVNSIAYEATMQVDMRSEDPDALDALDTEFLRILQEALDEERARWESDVPLDVEIDRWGLRPADSQPAEAPIVQAAIGAGEALGFTPLTRASSTDANLPMSMEIPSVTIGGGGSGTGAHSLDEEYDTTDSHLGSQWVLLFTLTLAGVM
jgi:acetylornithine deacetylase/succinyl-diaminopimelate desuccinylase-like protein